MKQPLRTYSIGKQNITVFFPSRKNITELCVGDLAPNMFGELAPVVEITARGNDINKRMFVCYYVKHGTNGTISHSMTQDSILRDLNVTRFYNSVELDTEEKRLRDAVGGIK